MLESEYNLQYNPAPNINKGLVAGARDADALDPSSWDLEEVRDLEQQWEVLKHKYLGSAALRELEGGAWTR